MNTCPFCKGPIEAPPPEFQLTKRQREVYEYIVAAGPNGADVDHVMADLYSSHSGTTLRTAVHYINRVMAPLKIVRKNHRYSVQIVEGDK